MTNEEVDKELDLLRAEIREQLAQGLERLAENTYEPDARAKQKALYAAADYVRGAQEESE